MISISEHCDENEEIGVILSNSANIGVCVENEYKNNLIDQQNQLIEEEEEEEEEDESIEMEETNDSKPNQIDFEKITPLPMMKILAIFVIMLCDAINSLSIFPYVNFLVSSFNLTTDKNKLGYFVGILASSYYMAQLVSSFFWGWFSNYRGRRPSLLLGLIGSMICLTGVGFSRNYPMVVVFRFLSGLLNGNVSIAKTMLGEITDSSNQAKAFSFIGLSWGVGGIIAPLIGGFFSNFCIKHYGSLSEGNIVCRFPYLLPNIICVLFSLTGLILGYVYLQESKTFSYSKIPSSSSTNLKGLSKKKIKSSVQRLIKKTKFLKSNGSKQQIDQEEDYQTDGENKVHDIYLDQEEIKDNNIKQEVNIRISSGIDKDMKSIPIIVVEEELEEVEEDLNELPRPISELYKDKPVIYSCLTYAFLGFMFTIFEEVFPNWSPVKRVYDPTTGITSGGGFGFSSSNIGTVQSSAGIFALIIQLFIFPRVVNSIGLLKAYRVALLIAIPTWVLLPELSRFCITTLAGGTSGSSMDDIHVDHPTIFWVFLFPVYMFQSFASEITFITIIVMVSNSALPKDMALVNSIGMFLVSISRSFGPTIAGALLAFSLTHSLPYPLDFHMVFCLLVILTVLLFVASFSLPSSLNYDKQKSNLLERIKNGEISQDVLLTQKDKPMVH
ncbi:hypothetical protein RB653_001718 [Dictyostelium firmibasis]|uniref:Major facilitator superfamily (MFS) profile domain-containing protein n=1 Tax=Dictyostelium firmibasis TaxID=79012 RepID=A0AAN7U5I6_9MYCE